MNNFFKKKIWKRWSPDLLSQQNIQNNINSKTLDALKNYSINLERQKKINAKILKEYLKGYRIGFDKGYQQGWCQGFNSISTVYLNNYEKHLQIYFADILKNFKKSIDDLNNKIELKILNIIMTISKIIFSETLLVNKKLILNKIKNIIQSIKNSFKNPKLFIHPKKRTVIEEKFGTLLKLYNWKLIDDTKININSCYVLTDEGEIDATVERCWNEIKCALFLHKDTI